MIPDGAREDDKEPIQGAEKKTLYRMSVFVDAEAAALICVLDAEKNKDAQRQPAKIAGQTGHNAVMECFTAGPPAAEKQEQAGKVDRQAPGELQEIEERPGPAGGSDRSVHVRHLFYSGRYVQ